VTTLLLVRHGETDWNRDHRWQGHSDPPLNDRGREQARELAGTLDVPDVVYASDLSRARETAEILASRFDVPIRTDARLRERDFGDWEGRTSDELERVFGDAFARWRSGEGHGADDSEPYEAFFERIRSFLADVVERHPDEQVLVVAHGGSVRAILAIAEGVDLAGTYRSLPSLANCAITRCAFRDGKLTRID
jgi:glucosyl-3-phosphoglycerate phosphatase